MMEQPDWISVTDKLPKENIKILFVGNKKFSDACRRCVPPANPVRFGCRECKNDEMRFVDIVSNRRLQLEETTHWMPLPEPPEDKQEER